MNWYVIMAYSGYELKVKAALEERIELAGLKDQFGEILVPTESVVELKSGAKKKTERKEKHSSADNGIAMQKRIVHRVLHEK